MRLTVVNRRGKEQMFDFATIWNLTKQCEILMGLHENGRFLQVTAWRRSDLYHCHWRLSKRYPQRKRWVLAVCMEVQFWQLELKHEKTLRELKNDRGH